LKCKINQTTECVTDLFQSSGVIIFSSLLTTFEVSVIFEAAGAQAKIDLSLKPNHDNKVYP